MMILAPTSIVNPATVHGTWFVDSVRLLAFLVVLVGLARISIAVFVASQRTEADRRHVARLLAAYGDSALAPFLLLDDKSWVFAPDGEAVIGFRVVASVAVALGGPVGADRSRRDAVMAFRDHCDAHGWVPVFHQVRDEDRADLEAGGLRFLKIGDLSLETAGGTSRIVMLSIDRPQEAADHILKLTRAPAPGSGLGRS